MGEPLANFKAKGVSSSSCLCDNTRLDPGCKYSCACCKVDFEAGIDDGQDELAVEEIGKPIAENDLNGTDSGEESDENDEPILFLEADSADDLVDAEPEAVISAALGSDNASESSVVLSDDGNSSTYGTPKLVSAMKGTRAKQGNVTKLTVSWAPDVYDPPVTSDSHTVKVHQRGSTSRNGRYKYKSSRNSSSSSSASGSKKDKKHSRHSSSSGSNKKDRRHSYRSSNTISGRADASGSNYRKTYSSSYRSSETLVTECAEASPSMPAERGTLTPLVPTEKCALPEAVPVLKTMEQIKCATSCSKEKPFALLSRQFSAARYKGMFSFWNQNQLAS